MSKLSYKGQPGHRFYALSPPQTTATDTATRQEWVVGSLLLMLAVIVVTTFMTKHPTKPIDAIDIVMTAPVTSSKQGSSNQTLANKVGTPSSSQSTQQQQQVTEHRLKQVKANNTAKPTPFASHSSHPQHQQVHVRPGDSLFALFIRMGGNASTFSQLVQSLKDKRWISQLHPSQVIDFYWDNHQNLTGLSLAASATHKLEITRLPLSNQWRSRLVELPAHPVTAYATVVLEQPIGALVSDKQFSSRLVQQIGESLGKVLNLNSDIHKGDQLSVVYQQDFIGTKNIHRDKLLGLIFQHNHQVTTFIRYSKDHYQGYFDVYGHSLSPGFDRYPIKFTHISSHFDLHRYHPILHDYRPHRGIDLVAAMGTPIHAVADGRIIYMGYRGGYGNMVKIRHTQGIETVYAHMQRYQPHLGKGRFVKRGQVIGYVGQTGLATAPHCHFEFRKHDQPLDPALVRLPAARRIAGEDMASFTSYTHRLLRQLANHMADPPADKRMFS